MPIQVVQRQQSLPLSFGQQRLWVLEQLEPDDPAYTIFLAVSLHGTLHLDALTQSLSFLVQRHETLRTTFTSQHGVPQQVIAASLELPLPLLDLQALSLPVQSDLLHPLIQQFAARPFDLEHGPLIRLLLLRQEPEQHVLLLGLHHLIADGWSLGVLLRDLYVSYRAALAGEPVPLAPLPVQYVDYAVWQRQWLEGERLRDLLAYWRDQLAGVSQVLTLPRDLVRSLEQPGRGALYRQRFSAELSQALKQVSQQEGTTLFMTLLTAFALLLARFSGQHDFLIGIDSANRTRAEVEELIGFFVNLLPLRINLKGSPTVREMLRRVRESALGAYEHQEMPFEQLVEALQPKRSPGQNPLVQVLFVLQNVPLPALELPGVQLQPLEVDTGTAKFDLALFFEESAEGLTAIWQYKCELFEASTIERLAQRFLTLSDAMASQLDMKIHQLDLLTEMERKQQMVEKQKHTASSFKKFKNVQPKTISLSQESLIKTTFHNKENLPLVIQPATEETNLIDWASNNTGDIEKQLLKYGALLFSGFKVASPPEFEKFASSICPELFKEYGDLPREQVSSKIYRSTIYPANQAIHFHNEGSHTPHWPLKIWFYCVQVAQQGGETPIVDCRQVHQKLAPLLRERFEQKQVMYVRNYIEGLDVSWQTFFQTNDRSVVEAICRRSSTDFEWISSTHLRTRQICPAVTKHPKTGENIFFNQLQLHHIACLEPSVRASLQSLFKEEDLPRNVYYGDGSPIEDSAMQEILNIYHELAITLPWQEGDIMMLDNMLVAHGRMPFVGQRKVMLGMGEMAS